MTRTARAAAACAVVLLLAPMLAGCPAAPAIHATAAGAVTAADAWCRAITAEARQATRDRLTGGRALLACPAEER